MVLLTIPPKRPLAPTFQRGGWWAEPFGAIPGPCPRISLGPPSLLLKAREALDAVGVQHASVTVWRCPCLTSDLYNSRKTEGAPGSRGCVSQGVLQRGTEGCPRQVCREIFPFSGDPVVCVFDPGVPHEKSLCEFPEWTECYIRGLAGCSDHPHFIRSAFPRHERVGRREVLTETKNRPTEHQNA
jgi:hypothetical protein